MVHTQISPCMSPSVSYGRDGVLNTSAASSCSSLSRTMTEAELLENQKERRTQQRIASETATNEKESFHSQEDSVWDEENVCKDHQLTQHSADTDHRPSPPQRQRQREKGPNEQLYLEKYSDFVADRINAFRDLPLYCNMSKEEQLREQARVLELLGRLKIAHEKETVVNCEPSLQDYDNEDVLMRNDDSQMSANLSVATKEIRHEGDHDDEMVDDLPDQSALLLSPNGEQEDDVSTSSSSCPSPVERPRAVRFESPTNSMRVEKKRLASTSGKRGADTVRLRSSESPCGLAASIREMSLADSQIFASSQSPISQAMAHSPIREDISPDISFGSEIHQENDTLVETAMLPSGRVRWDFDGTLEKEAPTDIQLLGASDVHLKRLPTKRPSDPLQFYPERARNRMVRLIQWISDRPKAVVLSLKQQELIDVVLSLQDEDCENPTAAGAGNVLVVCRSKADLDIWSRSLRELSSLSVLNHASLPLRERKSPAGSKKACNFDLVLTTYDALKSPDVTVTIDENGFVQDEASTVASDGWHSSSQSQAASSDTHTSKQQLSFLHRLHWKKVCFVDIVGRKSFLTKAGTARVQASLALQAQSRFVMECLVLFTALTSLTHL